MPCCWTSSQKPSGPKSRAKYSAVIARPVPVLLPEPERDLAREACREADDPLGVPLQRLPVDPRAPVEPFGEADGREPNEVPVAGAVLREQDQMAVVGGCPLRLLLLLAGAERQIRLEAEDRADPLQPGLLVEAPRGVQIPVVGDRETVHAELPDVRTRAPESGSPRRGASTRNACGDGRRTSAIRYPLSAYQLSSAVGVGRLRISCG